MKNHCVHNNNFLLYLMLIIFIIKYVEAGISGPFLLWGNEKLEELKSPALSAIDENILIETYFSSNVILLFLKESSVKLDKKNFPCLAELIEKMEWVYFPQNSLPAKPWDYNEKLQTVYLDDDDTISNDKLICETFNKVIKIHGKEHVLGILSNFIESDERSKFKRNVDIIHHEIHPVLYKDKGENFLLYTSLPPVLSLVGNVEDSNEEPQTIDVIKLTNPEYIEFEGDFENIINNDASLFNVTIFYFENSDHNVSVKFPFHTAMGYWSLSSVEIDKDEYSTVLELLGNDKPIAPHGFSYSCQRPLTFANRIGDKFTMHDIQVEPIFWKSEHRNETRFSDSYDCVGFVTVPILSGIFVSFLVIFVTLIGVVAIMEIKTPSRFDNIKSKQITIILNDQDIRN